MGQLLHWVTRCCIEFRCVERIDVAVDARRIEERAGWTAISREHAGREIACGTGEVPDYGSFATRGAPIVESRSDPGIDQGSAGELDAVRTLLPTSFDAGIPPHIVRDIAGHAAIDVTMTIYAHVSLDEKRNALRKLGERLE
jgi:hypothetical protein